MYLVQSMLWDQEINPLVLTLKCSIKDIFCYFYSSLLFLQKITFGWAFMSQLISTHFEKGIGPLVSFWWSDWNSTNNMKSRPCSYLHYLRVLYLTLPSSPSPVKISLLLFISSFLHYIKSIFIKCLPGTNHPLVTKRWAKHTWSLFLWRWQSRWGGEFKF